VKCYATSLRLASSYIKGKRHARNYFPRDRLSMKHFDTRRRERNLFRAQRIILASGPATGHKIQLQQIISGPIFIRVATFGRWAWECISQLALLSNSKFLLMSASCRVAMANEALSLFSFCHRAFSIIQRPRSSSTARRPLTFQKFVPSSGLLIAS